VQASSTRAASGPHAPHYRPCAFDFDATACVFVKPCVFVTDRNLLSQLSHFSTRLHTLNSSSLIPSAHALIDVLVAALLPLHLAKLWRACSATTTAAAAAAAAADDAAAAAPSASYLFLHLRHHLRFHPICCPNHSININNPFIP
jgi:hypothetical protein